MMRRAFTFTICCSVFLVGAMTECDAESLAFVNSPLREVSCVRGCGLRSCSLRFLSERRDAQRTFPKTSMCLSELIGDFQVGDKVKVKDGSIRLWNVAPKENPDGYLVPKGKLGEIIKLVTKDAKTGKPVSPNRPILVKFQDPQFTAHFEQRELEKA